MTIQDLGSIGELVAGIATVATLVYLALQIRESRVGVNSANAQNAIQNFTILETVVGSDESLSRIANRGVAEFESLDENERAQYVFLQRAFLNCFWNVFLQHKLGALSTENWMPYAPLGRVPGRPAWSSGCPGYHYSVRRDVQSGQCD